MRAAGVSVVERSGGPGEVATHLRELARQARDANEPLLICSDNLVAHASLLWMLATEPARRSTVLVAPEPGGDLTEDRGRVVPAPAGTGTVRFLGAMCIAPADLPLLDKVADRAELLPALLEAGLVPVATRTRLLHAEQVSSEAELTAARHAVDAVDEDAARLRLAVKEQDDFFTTYAVSTWSPRVTKAAARLRMTPTGVTALSVLFAAGAALLFWQASRIAMIAGAVLLYLGFVLDCVDGQLARYTRQFDAFGGWLDTMADRAKEYAVYAGLAAGAERIGLPYAWPLAITAIVLQTARHMTDTWYGALHDEAAAHPGAQPAGGVGARLSAASVKAQSQRGSLIYWAKRIVVFPIGERWALIAVLAAFTNGRTTLAAVVGFGLLAAAYTLVLRSLRALSMRVGVLNTVDTMRHRDDGPLVRVVLSRVGIGWPLPCAALFTAYALVTVGLMAPSRYPWLLALVAVFVLIGGFPARLRHGGALDWLVPAALRAGEYLIVAAVGLYGTVPPPVVFLLLFMLAMRHYDLTARMEKGAPATGAGGAPLGWDGRVLLLVLAALLGYATAGTAVLAALVGGAFVVTAVGDWRASR
ncbi:CDP-alcohol phosphatidyltransferase family protein [Actinoplanes sp. NEAU-A11]|uniref:CDP-alcohol phosphatidyltransferase family protein n=2 Tax=Actinoplanes aureus TaxID=2792083 RepID=A0A931G4D0_9ACTN|nr:CDP-alcohol phosphatidyltransferase family protein [Actinoplanes aureus]